MEGNGGQVSRRPFRLRESICGWSISYFVPFISHFYLLLVPLFSPSPSLLPNLFFSGVVLLIAAVVAKFFKLLLKLRASAPALGFFNILFVWSAYLAVLWQAIFSSRSILFNGGLVLLVVGLFRILWSDPGLDRHKDTSLDELMHSSTSEAATHREEGHPSRYNNLSCQTSFQGGSFSLRRVRYCRICKDYVRGFDHHCPAFGNCVKRIITCSWRFYLDLSKWRAFTLRAHKSIINFQNLAVSTMFFCLLQLLWQVVFLAWHIYCICFNI